MTRLDVGTSVCRAVGQLAVRGRALAFACALSVIACAPTATERAAAVSDLAGCYVARGSGTSRWIPGMFLRIDGPEVGLELTAEHDTASWEEHAYRFRLPGEPYADYAVQSFWVPTGQHGAYLQHYKTDAGFLMRLERRPDGGLTGAYWLVGSYESVGMPGRVAARRASCAEAARVNGSAAPS